MPGNKALSGVRVIVTRAKEQSAELIDMLNAAGAEVVAVPVIQTVPPEDISGIDRAVASLSSYDYALFTSVNSLKFLLLRMGETGKGPEDLKGLRIVAVGPKTAGALEKNGLKADIIPEESKAEGIVLALSGEDIRGKKFLYPRAEVAREVLPEALRAAGAIVDVVTVYRTVAPSGLSGVIRGALSGEARTVVTFTSSSTVTNFLNAAGPGAAGMLSGTDIACIGPVTAKTCEEAGLSVDVIPREYTAESLFLAVVDHFNKEKSNA
ncbi:MAG: uroporphyrinogen-III synthase [Nitrospirota bacterium]